MKLRDAAFVLAMALATPVFAQQAGPTTDPAKLEGGVFALERGHARVIFSYNHLGFSTSYGMFTDFAGDLTFDPKAVEKSKLDVTFKMSGIDTTVPKLDEHLKSEAFFDVAKYPTAAFKSTKVTVTGPNTGKVEGDLTLHGVTKPVVLDVTFNGGGVNPVSKAYDLGFNATGHVKRSDFGMNAYVPYVSDDVMLTISTEFNRKP